LVEGLVRRADPKGRTTSQFFKEEIAHKHDLDISIGVESYSDFLRSAVLTQPTALDFIRDTILDLRMLVMIGAYYAQPVNSILSLASKNPSFLQMHTDHIPFNSYEIQRLKLGAINGLSGAHDLARLFSLFLNGTIVSSRTLNQMTRPTIEDWHIERTVLYPIMKGFGFFYETHPIVPGKYIMGHPGYGCQSIHVDPEMDLVVAYLSNGLKSATSLLCAPYQRMLQEVYRSV
jgi:hypothetical protein